MIEEYCKYEFLAQIKHQLKLAVLILETFIHSDINKRWYKNPWKEKTSVKKY